MFDEVSGAEINFILYFSILIGILLSWLAGRSVWKFRAYNSKLFSTFWTISSFVIFASLLWIGLSSSWKIVPWFGMVAFFYGIWEGWRRSSSAVG